MRYGCVNKKYKLLIINNKILQYAEIRRFGTRARAVGVEIGANASEYTGNVPNRPVFWRKIFLICLKTVGLSSFTDYVNASFLPTILSCSLDLILIRSLVLDRLQIVLHQKTDQ